MEPVGDGFIGSFPSAFESDDAVIPFRKFAEVRPRSHTYDISRDLRLYSSLEQLERGCQRKIKRAKRQQNSQKAMLRFLPNGETTIKYSQLKQSPEDVIKEKKLGPYRIGVAAYKGLRDSMEDTFYYGKIKWGKNKGLLACVFDGHGGTEASLFLKKNASLYINEALQIYSLDHSTPLTIARAIQSACIKLDDEISGECGATAVIALIFGKKVYFANVGDSRGIICRKDEIIQATVDAKLMPLPCDLKQLAGIEYKYTRGVLKRGGRIKHEGPDSPRVTNGRASLNMGRAFGDGHFTRNGIKFVVARPEITYFSLEDDDLIILASDGLWDVASTDEAGEYARELVEKNLSLKKTAAHLSYGALVGDRISTFSQDNTTTLVIRTRF